MQYIDENDHSFNAADEAGFGFADSYFPKLLMASAVYFIVQYAVSLTV
jgi:hypothetical protein